MTDRRLVWLAALVLAPAFASAQPTVDRPAQLEMVFIQDAPHWLWHVDLDSAIAASSTAGDHPSRSQVGGGLRWQPHHNESIGDAIVELDGAVGAETGSAVPYRASLRIGTEAKWYPQMFVFGCPHGCSDHRTGIVIGLRVDADGNREPRAWTAPIDADWYFARLDRAGDRFGLVGEIAPRIVGAARRVGWSAGVDFVHPLALREHDVHVGVAFERETSLALVALRLSLTSRDRYDEIEQPMGMASAR